jgi:hypothetical protein
MENGRGDPSLPPKLETSEIGPEPVQNKITTDALPGETFTGGTILLRYIGQWRRLFEHAKVSTSHSSASAFCRGRVLAPAGIMG